jgi:hypothetical protein
MTRKASLRPLFFLLSMLLVGACARLPVIKPPAPGLEQAQRSSCDAVFPQGKWQFVHAIEAALSGGRSVVLGVSTISSDDRHVHSLIMTVEGLVLFEADSGERLRIERAVPPFDSKDFARGLMDDIGFLFFAPPGPVTAWGRFENGSPVCRHRTGDGGVVDIVLTSPDSWQLRQYGPQGRLIRRLQATGASVIRGQRIPRRLVLEARAAGGKEYRLKLKLVEAVPYLLKDLR